MPYRADAKGCIGTARSSRCVEISQSIQRKALNGITLGAGRLPHPEHVSIPIILGHEAIKASAIRHGYSPEVDGAAGELSSHIGVPFGVYGNALRQVLSTLPRLPGPQEIRSARGDSLGNGGWETCHGQAK
jgi:hypothetical protein